MLLAMPSSSVYSQAFGDGYYRLNTQLLGEDRSLDVINDGANNKLHLTAAANVSGQFWKITPVGDGFYRLTTGWLGENKSLDVVNDGAQLTIEDNGPGFTPEALAKAFTPFMTTKASGTGLGLAIVQKVIVSHNGTIAAGNLPEGGARFQLRLPATGSGRP